MDIASILVIVWFIGLTYYKRYKDNGDLYVKTQLELISAYCISLVVNLYAYYWAEERFNIDEKYTKGIILTFVFVVAGYIGKVIYKIVFYNRKKIYTPTKEEYLFITETAFLVVTIKMVSEGIIGCAIPIAILLGRMMWIDTESLKEILSSIKVSHYRIIESSILLIVGVIYISCVMSIFHPIRAIQIVMALLYGIIISGPLEKNKKMFKGAFKWKKLLNGYKSIKK